MDHLYCKFSDYNYAPILLPVIEVLMINKNKIKNKVLLIESLGFISMMENFLSLLFCQYCTCLGPQDTTPFSFLLDKLL